jgi:outer membrane immunogenic protein
MPKGGNLSGGQEMRNLLILCGFILIAASAAQAQEGKGFEVTGNYQYVRFNPGNGASGINCQGGSGSGAGYLTASFGIVGEFGACKVTGLPSGASAHAMDYLFGPRLYFHAHGRVYPFVQGLFGGERLSAGFSGVGSGSANAFAAAVGGGADVTLTRHVSLRALQVDYLYTHFGGASQNNFRLQSGIVWRIGR